VATSPDFNPQDAADLESDITLAEALEEQGRGPKVVEQSLSERSEKRIKGRKDFENRERQLRSQRVGRAVTAIGRGLADLDPDGLGVTPEKRASFKIKARLTLRDLSPEDIDQAVTEVAVATNSSEAAIRAFVGLPTVDGGEVAPPPETPKAPGSLGTAARDLSNRRKFSKAEQRGVVRVIQNAPISDTPLVGEAQQIIKDEFLGILSEAEGEVTGLQLLAKLGTRSAARLQTLNTDVLGSEVAPEVFRVLTNPTQPIERAIVEFIDLLFG